MQVKQIMTREFRSIPPDMSIRQAAETMRSLDVGMLPVMDGGTLLGLLTDRDIVLRVVSDGKVPESTAVDGVMSTDIVTCKESDDVERAAEAMERHQLRRLMVSSEDGRIVGVISLADLAQSGEGPQLGGEVLQEVSQPAH